MGDPYAFTDIRPLWSVVDPLSVEDAAALIAGYDPHSIDGSRQFLRDRDTNWTESQGIAAVQPRAHRGGEGGARGR